MLKAKKGGFSSNLLGGKREGCNQGYIVFLELRIDRKPGRCSFLGMKACLTSSCGTHWKM